MLKPRRLPCVRQFSAARIVCNTAESPARSEATSPTSTTRGRSEMPLSRNAASHSHRKAFVQWVNGPGKIHASPAEGRGRTNYLDGKTHPFPLNPAFQPSPPLARSIKQDIIQDWKTGIGLRQLSTKWGVSLERIDAILKLQAVREKWDTQGRRTMQSYADTMDQVLGTKSAEFGDYEPKHNLTIDPGRQIFTLIPEAASYTPEDAAEELGKIPFGKRQENFRTGGRSRFEIQQARKGPFFANRTEVS
ncbi:eukaryotic mitochondrial regulator protein-domain-containing protein [Protomyces lactucae-debilis]|uniref:Eukaryotic mitochondrial regulator protein-domain-containing protein n=1 Tax=Protomyces lactucae-debilis TaxID=2754530 RepID=A0A1Y2FS42_PROLT|nr:eukaryotic mitochondrial regulator protein-domain-containing protein [Protomyces lactucae-debilis]ORY86769.1 eukaryotic mitochondrial regulator protein-domain-containing protein [Protomyces lactucae-debilis]